MRFTSKADIPVAEFLNTRAAVAEACAYFQRTPGPIGFDTETSGLDFDGLLVDVYCVGLANHERRVVIPTWGEPGALWGDGAKNLESLLPFLAETQSRHAGYNWIYDVNALYGYTRWKLGQQAFQLKSCWADGLKLFCHFDEEGEDTYGVKRLKDRCRHWLGLPMNDFDKVVQGHGFAQALQDNFTLAVDYAGRDAWGHLGLCLLGQQTTQAMPWCPRCPHCNSYCFQQHPDRSQQWYCAEHGWVRGDGEMASMWDWHTDFDVPFLHVLQKMQVRGVPMNWQYLHDAEAPLRAALARSEEEFHEEVAQALSAHHGAALRPKLNMNSDQQLRELYHTEFDSSGNPVGFGYPAYAYTDTGLASMKDDALRALMVRQQAPGVLAILEHRKLQKILSTYVIGLAKRRFPFDTCLHGSYRPTTTTGRLRSADPNMQNLPTRTISVMMPPASPYIPTIQEMVSQWAYTQEEAERELQLPEYQSKSLDVNIRRAVEALEGDVILCADYSQLEIRLTALDSRCPALIKVLNEGLDMHCYAAARAFAAALQGVTYEDIFEAKQSGEGDMRPRWSTLASMMDPTRFEEVLIQRTCKLPPEQSEQLRQKVIGYWDILAEGWDTLEIESRGQTDIGWWVDWLQENYPEELALLLKILGLRDKEWLNLRKAAKSAIFGIIYGIGPGKLAAQIMEATKQPFSIKEAKELIRTITEEIFAGIGKMVSRQKTALRSRGYVRTAMGRYRQPAGVFSGNSGKRAKAERQSTNSPIQGLAADVVQRAMLAIDVDEELIRYGAVLLLQVHDELLLRCPLKYAVPALARMRHLMETAHGLYTPVPLSVTGHAATTWDAAK